MNMLTILGYSLLILALLISAKQLIRPSPTIDRIESNLTLASQAAPFALLASAFMFEATSLELVSGYVGEGLPALYRISAVWGSRAGPLLMWACFMGAITWAMSRDPEPDMTAIRVMHGWTGAILLVSAILKPFSPSSGGPGGVISPLLQTDLMVIHPPVVFVYYSLCLATASVAVAGLIRSRPPEETHESLLRWARYSLLAGAIGIGLGGLWAYTVLDWGGYWAWDPVETGSLLPWMALLAIVHARARGSSSGSPSITPALALVAGALVMHATLVTRANGVWASVHAFVGDGEGSMPSDPYARVIEIIDFSPVGFEVMTYLAAVASLLCLAVLHVLRVQWSELGERGSRTLLEHNRALSLLLLACFSLVALWIGSSAVLFIGLSSLILLVNGDHRDPPAHWVALGVLLMLFSSWAWISEWYQSLAGIAPFLIVWVLPEEEGDELSWVRGFFSDESSRLRSSRSFPWYLSSAFLLLTWVLLTVEIDGTNLEAHEYYGAPMIALLAIGLGLYGWGRGLGARTGNLALASAAALSFILAANAGSLGLPGDHELPITDSVSRGALSAFLLTWLAFAIPPTLLKLWRGLRESAPVLASEGIRARPARSRMLGSHIAHAGILLLLVGHVLTTTLVDRSDPSHFVTLERGQPTEHDGLELVFTGVEVLSAEDDQYDFSIGDGYVGVVIEVWDGGQRAGTLSPGMLRFDSPSGAVSARSEVDRMSSLTGDTIVILDLLQSNELLSSMIMGQTDQVDQVRVTVHHLPGSHLIWAGWLLVVLGIALASVTRSSEEYIEDEFKAPASEDED